MPRTSTRRGTDQLSRALLLVATVAVYAMLVVIMANVVGRAVFGTPVPAAFEIGRILMPIVVFGALAWTFASTGHFRMTFVRDRVPAGVRVWLDRLQTLLYLAVFAALTWVTTEDALESVSRREYEPGAVQVPIYPARVAIALGCAAVLVVLVRQLLSRDNGGRD